MNNEKWYKNGLHFSCTMCGNCCTGAPGVVWVSSDEIEQIAGYLKKTVGEISLCYTRIVASKVSLTEYANGDCCFFDAQTRKCSIYAVRPQQCRNWPFWKSNLQSPDQWREVQQVCPGARQGAFVSLEEIEAQANLVDL